MYITETYNVKFIQPNPNIVSKSFDMIFEHVHIKCGFEGRVCTALQSRSVLVIATTQEKVAHHRAYGVTRQGARGSACGVVDGADVTVKPRHGVAGWDENSVLVNSGSQVGVLGFAIDDRAELQLGVHKSWS